jgi:hypothetical protein
LAIVLTVELSILVSYEMRIWLAAFYNKSLLTARKDEKKSTRSVRQASQSCRL